MTRLLARALVGSAALVWAMPAFAVCPAANQYSFSFASQTAATLNYASSYNYTASAPGGATQNFTVSFATSNLTSSVIAGNQMPAISTLINDGAGNSLVVGGIFNGRTADIFANPRTIRTTFTFATPIRDFTMTVHDIDFAVDQFRDWFAVVGSNGASTYVPAITTPFGQTNGAGNPHTNAGSSLSLGPESTPYVVNEAAAVGTGSSGSNNDNVGNLTFTFPQPVTAVTLRYGNYPFVGSDNNGTGQQGFGIDGVSFCPMPALSVSKTSSPVATTGVNRFNVPQADIDYTLTIQNTGGSPVDIDSAVLADVLPPAVTFFNGDIDAGTAGTQNYVFTPGTSGLTLAAGNIAYSNNGGATYAYAPGAGYDTNVNALRFVPQGTMAANSSFSIRFRTRID